MKMNLCRGQAVNLSLRLRDALKDRDGLLFHPRREFALADEMLDLGEAALFVMAMFVVLVMLLAVRVVVAVVLFAVMVRMLVGVTGFMLVTMRVREMHVKLHPFDGGLVLARDVLKPQQRSLCIVAALMPLDVLPQLKDHVQGALNLGNKPKTLWKLYEVVPKLFDNMPKSAKTAFEAVLGKQQISDDQFEQEQKYKWS